MNKTLRGVGITLIAVLAVGVVLGGITFGLYKYSQHEKAEAERKKAVAAQAEQQRIAEEERVRQEAEKAAQAEQDRQAELARKQAEELAAHKPVVKYVVAQTPQTLTAGLPYWLKGNPRITIQGQVSGLTASGAVVSVKVETREVAEGTHSTVKRSNGTLGFANTAAHYTGRIINSVKTYTIKNSPSPLSSGQSVSFTGVETTGVGGGNDFYIDR